jgi:DNA-binding NarL/FixJ family response regulator
MIRILIADDHKIFREGLVALLDGEPELQVVGEAKHAQEVMEQLAQQPVEVILMDVDMGDSNGIDTTRQVKAAYPQVNVLALTMHAEHDYIVRMLDAGATGYILKNTGLDEMVMAIRAVSSGGTYYSQQVSASLVEHLTKPKKQQASKGVPLTPRELEVLKLIAEEYANPEIAEKLFISVRTVDTHRRNLIEKLGVKNTAGLVKYALRHGIIE